MKIVLKRLLLKYILCCTSKHKLLSVKNKEYIKSENSYARLTLFLEYFGDFIVISAQIGKN